MAADTTTAEPGQRSRGTVIEIIAVVLMGLASVATAWSSYQAALWSGTQAEEYTRASALRVESSRATSTANTLRSVDVATFMAWVEAYARDDARVAGFYETRFRAEFKPAFEAWIAMRPTQNPDAPPVPFVLDVYRLRDDVLADSLSQEADEAFVRGRLANDLGDRYVLALVVFATVLFLSGLTQAIQRPGPRHALIALSLLMFLAGVYGLITLPRL